MGAGGRPTKLDDDMIKDAVKAIKKVLVLRHAAALCCVHHDSFYEWLNRAKADREAGVSDSLFVKFSDSLKKARAEKINEFIECIAERQKNWQANAWLLERCFREDFGMDAGVIQDLFDRQGKMESLLSRYLDNQTNGQSQQK